MRLMVTRIFYVVYIFLLRDCLTMNVCTPSNSTEHWAFTVDQESSFSCSSSVGKTNDMGNSPKMCIGNGNSVFIKVQKNKAECLVAKSTKCKIPMRDFVSLVSVHISIFVIFC